MKYFISGGAKNGKSTLAQDLAVFLAQGKAHYYVATMISSGAEDDACIKRHIDDRAGLGFQTIECPLHITDCLSLVKTDAVFLVDSVTALIQNALFSQENNYEPDIKAATLAADELIVFAQSVRDVIFVSDYIYSDPLIYTPTTECYRRCLAQADRRLAALCDTVVEVCAGQTIIHKGSLCL